MYTSYTKYILYKYFLVTYDEVPGSNPGRDKQLVFIKVSSN